MQIISIFKTVGGLGDTQIMPKCRDLIHLNLLEEEDQSKGTALFPVAKINQGQVAILHYRFVRLESITVPWKCWLSPTLILLLSLQFRRCLVQLFCFRLLRFHRSLKERPAVGNEKLLRPIVMSQKARDRPKKKVTFSSSSVVFIITSDDTQQIDDSTSHTATKVNVIQVKPL